MKKTNNKVSQHKAKRYAKNKKRMKDKLDWYNSITRTLNDPEAMKTASAIWCEQDGWRGWNIKENGSYYFHDIPEKGLSDIFDIIYYKEKEM